MATLWTDHSRKQYHLSIKLFLKYFNFFFFLILPGARLLWFTFLRVRFSLLAFLNLRSRSCFPFQKNESLIISYTTGAYSHGILNIIIPFYLFLILSAEGRKTNYWRFDWIFFYRKISHLPPDIIFYLCHFCCCLTIFSIPTVFLGF